MIANNLSRFVYFTYVVTILTCVELEKAQVNKSPAVSLAAPVSSFKGTRGVFLHPETDSINHKTIYNEKLIEIVQS